MSDMNQHHQGAEQLVETRQYSEAEASRLNVLAQAAVAMSFAMPEKPGVLAGEEG